MRSRVTLESPRSWRLLLWVVFVSMAFPFVLRAQITPESIAASIAYDSGQPAENYREYSVKLATLLGTYSPAALVRILGENSVEIPDGQTLNEALNLQPINFEYGSATLSPGSYAELGKVANFLRANPEAKILIEGHVSEQYAGAQNLSEARATSAKLFLAQKGIDPSRVETKGFGYSQPLEGGSDEQNRRIEIRVLDEGTGEA